MKREREKIICTICTRIGVFFFLLQETTTRARKIVQNPFYLIASGRAVMMIDGCG